MLEQAVRPGLIAGATNMSTDNRVQRTEKKITIRYTLNAKRCAQSVLESTVAYIAAMAILGAAMGIFAWGIAHIPIRQVTYEATRVMAGTPRGRNVDENGAKPTLSTAVWPTYSAGGGVTP